MPDFVLGMDAKLYYGPESTALASLTEQPNVRDLTLTLEKAEADVTTRANSGWRATTGTLKTATIEFEMVWKTNDSGFATFKDAFLSTSDLLSLAALTGDSATSDTEGLHGDFSITGFTETQALEDAILVSVTAKLTVFTAWVNVA